MHQQRFVVFFNAGKSYKRKNTIDTIQDSDYLKKRFILSIQRHKGTNTSAKYIAHVMNMYTCVQSKRREKR